MKRLLLIIMALSAIVPGMAKDSYIPLPDRKVSEYIYMYESGNTFDIPMDAVIEHDNWLGFDSWQYLNCHGYKDNSRDSLASTIFKKIGDECVYFDYTMQIGDTLNVFLYETTTSGGSGDHQFYVLLGKHIKVTSIETKTYNGVERLCYNLESRDVTYCLSFGYENDYNKYYQTISKVVESEPYNDAWIEGIGYTAYNSDSRIYRLRCVFENGENLYTAEGADCNGLSDNVNTRIDVDALTLHRSGDVVVAVFPAVGAGDTITLYDSAGRVVASKAIREGATTTSIGIGTLPGGIYIARLTNGATAKMIWN